MSKLYKVDLNIDVSKVTPNSGFLMKNVDKEVDQRGFVERSGAEVLAFLCDVAVQGANPKVSYAQLEGFRKVLKSLSKATEKGELVCNKTDLDILKNSVRGNTQWPNSDEMFDILEQIMNKLGDAKEVNENPSSAS